MMKHYLSMFKYQFSIIFLLMTLGSLGAWGQVITPTTDPNNPVYYLFQSFGNTGFYMRPDGTGKVSTSNILTDDMKWYFLDSDESGYYYICDKDGNYLYFSQPSGSQNSRTWMELKSLDNNDTEHYKFSIAKNNTKGWNAYNIIPYGNTNKYCLNKQGRNAGTNGVQVANGYDDENSNWVFIPMTDYVWTLRADCFRPSDSSNKYFYKIKSKADANYFIKPGTTYVETSNTVDDDMIWYFEEASSDDYMTYYYIRLANDGQYLRYRSTAGGQDNAIELASHTGSETGDAEDRFQFIVVRGAVSNEPWDTKDISYNIVPKLLKRTNDKINFYCVSSNKGLGKPLKTRNDRASTDNKWNFVSVDFPTICAKPTITFSNTTGKASITTTTTRSTIYYTTDGSVPSTSNGEVYTAPFEVAEPTTIKAIVTRTDFSDSQVTTKTIDKVATPSIQNTEPSVVSISSATNGATIYYTTDGSNPTTSSTPYTEPVTITATSVTIKAIAVKDGMINSAVSTESFTFACATPTISFDNTTNTVTIASETGSTIYYAYGSTDPADPTVDESVAHGSSPVSFTISDKTYIKAIAIKEGITNSAVQSATIDKVAAPTISFTSDGKVKLTSSTPGVTLYYEIGDDASSVATPTTSSTRYTSPLSNVSGKVIKAIAVKEGWLTSDIGGSDGKIELQCAQPVIRRGSGNTISITCDFPAEGVSIYYTTDGLTPSYPTIVGTLYDKDHPEVMVNFPTTVKAIAVAEGYKNSSVATETITADLVQDDGYYLIASVGDFEKFVTMANSTGAGDKYKVVDNFTVSGNTTVSTTFTGVFEGDFDDESGEFFTISGLRKPLFNTTNNAVIKNVILDNVSISSGTNVGAICGEATGDTRIYNCGVLDGSVGGSNNVGGIVGLLDGRARVINCYNYANITSGSNCGGIVGYNNVASTSSNLQTMVMNCMFYGNITGGNAAPIYGGANIHNKYTSADDTGLNNYCYFLYDEDKNPYVKSIANDKYHGALGAEERYLNRFEFFRMTLNSTRNLAAYYVTGDATQKAEMAKWVLDKSIAPYPILKVQGTYPSIVNPDAAHATTQTERNKGGKLGTLSVTISGTGSGDVFDAPTGASITTSSLTLNITDKDYDNFNFNYKKVQLPYYNEVGTGNYTGDRVVTGWKITSITGGTPGSFTTETYNYPSFNFVDRKCTKKDLYGDGGSNRVFAQGAYWEVPDGVTAITIEPYWAKAVYLSDANYDVTYTVTMSGSTATANKYGVTVCGSCPTDYNEQTVYTDLSTAITNLASNASHKVYDYAVVLVGNYHQAAHNALVNNGKPITFMSADFDGDNEPDNTLFYYHNQRKRVSPMRFDFLNIPGVGMVKRTYDATMDPEPGIFSPQGWFEITNTVFIRCGQFEYGGSNNGNDKTIMAPLILQGGIYEQFVSCCRADAQNTNYLLIGGNAWFKNFANGCHTNQANKTPKVPINVAGGDYTNFYLTGIYQPASNEDAENAECYIDGGRFTEVAGAGMQQIKGDVTWLINAADITSFYGGGINAAKPITGSISTTISNSYVDEFYGGPKFGDMAENKTVTTNATDCHFDKFFGAGYGGTAFNRVGREDDSKADNSRGWSSWVTKYYKREYDADNGGISTNYDYEFILHSDGNQTVARFYVDYASLSLASTRNVTSTLSGCTIGTFYGGGSLGAVNGDVNSTLTNCTVTDNAFGAGFSASVPTVEVWNSGANLDPQPTYNRTANVFNNASVKTPKDNDQYVVYTWSNSHGSNSSPFVETEDGKHYIHTDVSLDGLGAVTGNVTLIINGNTVADEDGKVMTVGKSVYGGGEESAVNGNTTVNVTGGTIGVEGQGGATWGNVYGGGKGKQDDVTAGLVKGNTNINISGSPRIYHNVYGGGAYGSVGTFTYDANNVITGHTANTGKTEVTITGGTFGWNGKENGIVFGSSRGDVGAPESNEDKLAWVYDTKVSIGTSGSGSVFTTPTIRGSVYGGGENGHVFHDAEVNIYSGTIGIPTGTPITNNNGTPDDPSDDVTYSGAYYPYRGNVYGAGCGTDKYYSDPTGVADPYDGNGDSYNPKAGIVQGTTTVNISGGYVAHNVYGAGAMGSVGTASDAASGKTTINISGGRIGYDGNRNGNVFGAARGEYGISTVASGLANVRETEVNISYATTPTADNGEKTVQLITGSLFGGGESGTVKGSVAVNMTGGLILKDIYGGGALADTQTSNWDASANDGAGDWATGKSSTSATTTVRLTGGRIGEEVFGGGLGEAGKPAYVWGDVLLDLNGTTPIDGTTHKPSTTGTATTNATGCVVGQVFGCNNVNGTPKGDVMVHVYATQNAAATQIANTPAKEASGNDPAVPAVEDAKVKGRYDVTAVYGGGNQAAYDPVSPYTTSNTSGAKTQVIIDGCSLTSIETVYGGGNAAAVPETNVEVRGTYEIGYIFGGGNGKDDIAPGVENPGADVGTLDHGESTYGTGNANTLLKGGLIHEAYGGSNQKGIIKGSINQTSNPDGSDCELEVEKIVGAGKYADIDGDVNMTLSCQPNKKVNELFAGADEANVNGNITLNITNGHFGNVFGGNNLGGAVKGKIMVNVEETGCQPIKIDNLYLGGNQAAYSVFGYYESDEIHPVTGKKILKPRTAEMHAITDPTAVGYKAPVTNPATDATHTFPYAQPELNIISCTYIGNVFGGGLGAPAKMYANPTVNVNMVPGVHAATAVPTMMTELGLDVTKTAANPDKLGIIRNVFGGGDAADIDGSTTVNIATEEGKSAYIIGSIFGGGNAADVLGNTNVTMSGGYVFNGVFGGGYAGSVGTFTRSTAAADINVFGHTAHDGCIGKPIACAEGTGKCTVVVNGGQIGPISVATQGMNRAAADGGPVPEGWVWGGGQGLIEDPAGHPDTHFSSYVGSTDVTIGGTALVMESIIGGGEFGRVLGNTLVKIEGGQIGVGANQTETVDGVLRPKRYTDAQFVNPLTTTITNENALAECSHFPYGRNIGTDENPNWVYLPYDPYYGLSKYSSYIEAHPEFGPASTSNPSDGKTWIGCVFAGGSGYMPYEKEDGTGYDWCPSAGLVEGNSEVRISGGHILTNVYGGNEITDVKRKTTVKMTGGTIGVPRTVEQIAANPVFCYLFGAGKGDERPRFYEFTNVGNVEVEISGGIIYGSVFGGSEDGHVTGDVSLTIKKGNSFTIGSTTYNDGPIIGTWGTSYIDGNVFGGGRGFSGNTLTAGNVGGNVTLNIEGGTILGSVYGGGRLASVGTYLVDTDHANYGKLIPDNGDETHGHIAVNISGGTIGNGHEYIMPTNTDNWTAANWKTWKDTNHVPNTEYGTTDTDKNRLMHTKGGNVFAGSMGRLYALNGSTVLTHWADLGKAKQTEVTVSGGTIKSNVYGGGELGAVVNGAKVTIEGGTIGTEVKDTSDDVKYTYGSAFGGGYGSDANVAETYSTVEETSAVSVKDWAGRVKGGTQVKMEAGETTTGKVMASVYGGGELAWVDGSTQVTVSAGEIGKNELNGQNTKFGGYRMGNVYGGGKGSLDYVKAGLVTGNADVTINGTTETAKIYHNIYGGGALGSVGTFTYDANLMPTGMADANTGTATVKIIGGTIGINGHDNGMINGSSRGGEGNPNTTPNLDRVAWVKNTVVEIGKDGDSEAENTSASVAIKGSVYGGGENGHNLQDAQIKVYGGTIGNASATGNYDCGNIYGAGCGTDTYWIDADDDGVKDANEYHHNPMAGVVRGTTAITINGGNIIRGIYGGGSMGSVGGSTTVANAGKTTITVNGGTIGTDDDSQHGNVYGGPKGNIDDTEVIAEVREALLNINAGANVKGSVFGGGEAGVVKENVVVNMNGGNVGQDVYGGGALANTNVSNWDASANSGQGDWADEDEESALYTTSVNLKGGTINHNVYGGGLGRIEREAKAAVGTEGAPGYEPAVEHLSPVEALVYGDVKVDLNTTIDNSGATPSYPDNCVVKGCVFGCNNLNGTPKGTVTVHVQKTQGYAGHMRTGYDAATDEARQAALNNIDDNQHSYEVSAVYGGGNLAAYVPVDLTNGKTRVIIDGCQLTSIRQVYGGGNAASTPATQVDINGTYEIEEVFGGGNGKDRITVNEVEKDNPGANVGFYAYEDDVVDDTDTPENRATNYGYGTGQAKVNIYGGRIHRVYGGSNTKGNVRQIAVTMLDESSGCDFCVDEAYGGGKSANMDGQSKLEMACIPGLRNAYGGAENADIQNDVTLSITNGNFDRVFGGNNVSGTIRGKITVNVEETGCHLITIGQLYGGGNQAEYEGPFKTGSTTERQGPTLNVRSFTSIGEIYGGGYGKTAKVTGDTEVNINVCEGKNFGDNQSTEIAKANAHTGNQTISFSEFRRTDDGGFAEDENGDRIIDEQDIPVYLPPFTNGNIGSVNNVYGGGNAAPVDGNTFVNIGTETGQNIVFSTPTSATVAQRTHKVKGVNIVGNVYGGGNQAEVTGNTNVQIGRKVE